MIYYHLQALYAVLYRRVESVRVISCIKDLLLDEDLQHFSLLSCGKIQSQQFFQYRYDLRRVLFGIQFE